MAVVTKQWSSESLTPGEAAAEVYEVLGAVTARQAIDAAGVPRSGTQHPQDRLLISKKPQAQRMTPSGSTTNGGYWHVRVSYVAADSEEGKENENEDPLKRLPTYDWRIGLQGEPFDRDIKGNPIVNSAREPFSTPPNFDVMTLSLLVTRNERGYDIDKAFFFHNAVNSDEWVVPGTRQTVKPGQARCLGIRPAGEFNLAQTFVSIQYEFEFRGDGFDLRIMDQGPRAAAESATGAANIIDVLGEQVTSDVLLNGHGQPIKTGYTVAGSAFSYIDPPKGAVIEATPDAVFLKYERNPRRPFAQMGLR
jgi:hypothetical protein